MDPLTAWFASLPKGQPRHPEAFSALLQAWGQPEERFSSFHITGTNGKGSTAAILAALLTAQGLRTGLYTSPHLERFTERFRLNGRELSGELLTSLLADLRKRQVELNPFETATALAFKAFGDLGAATAVIEVGAGGASDPTNVLKQPLASIITGLAADHLDRFGPTLADLAREKTGILKPFSPVVLGGIPNPAVKLFRSRAQDLGCPLWQAGADFRLHRVRLSRTGTLFDWEGPGIQLRDLRLSLLGREAAQSAALALAALTAAGLLPREEIIRQGLAAVRWPGRLELHPGPSAVLLDGAHNPAATRALARNLRHLWPEGYHLLAAGSRPPTELLAPLLPRARSVTLTLVPGAATEVWADYADSLGARFYPDPEQAWAALASLNPAELRLITGSLYLVGRLRSSPSWRRGAMED